MVSYRKPAPRRGGRGWNSLIRRWRQSVEDLLFPPQCLQCGDVIAPQQRPAVCAHCLAAWDSSSEPRCQRCGARRPQRAEPLQGCCRRPQQFDRCFALGSYTGALRETVLRLKRPGNEVLAMAVADLMVEKWKQEFRDWGADCVMSVPMHWRRRLVRGVNNPEVLADRLGRRLGLPRRSLLTRRRHTRLQAGLSAGDRQQNLRGAFRWRHRGTAPARVLLVDDILTTGSTCNEVTNVLKKSGVKVVAAVTIARTEEVG